MKLSDITVKKFIEIKDITSLNCYPTSVDRDIALLVCLTGNTEDFYLSMLMPEFREHEKTLDFLKLDSVQPKAKRYIKANGKVYAPVYEFKYLSAGQFVDVTHFLKDKTDFILNLPKILASICVPTKRTLTGRKLLPYGAIDHDTVSVDMESASIEDAYAIAVFFWNVLKTSLENTGDYLISSLLKKKGKEKLTAQESEALLNILHLYGDGIIARKESQSLNG